MATKHHPLGRYRTYELFAAEEPGPLFTGYARPVAAGDQPPALVAYSVTRNSLEAAEADLKKLIDEELGARNDETQDLDLTARLQRLRRDPD
jgi:hypothetical protein